MVKMENDVAIPSKPVFYRRFVDDIYSRRKLEDKVLLQPLNNYNPDIKLNIELNPITFLDTKLTKISGVYKFNIYPKKHKTIYTMDLQNS